MRSRTGASDVSREVAPSGSSGLEAPNVREGGVAFEEDRGLGLRRTAAFADVHGLRATVEIKGDSAHHAVFLARVQLRLRNGVRRGEAHVIFAGLAFMFNQGSLTVDADARRVRLGGGFKGAAFL